MVGKMRALQAFFEAMRAIRPLAIEPGRVYFDECDDHRENMT